MKQILFPTDYSQSASNAFEACLHLADHLSASVRVLHVVLPEYEAADVPILSSGAIKTKIEIAKDAMVQFVDQGVHAVYKKIKNEPNITTDIEVGSPAGVIAEVSERDESGMIVIGTRSKHSKLEEVIGSVTAGVLARSKVPVMVIPEETTHFEVDTIGFATDLQESDPFHVWKTCKILESFGAIVRCIHVDTRGEDHEIEMEDLERFFTDHAPALQIHFHTLKSKDVEEGLLDFANTYDIDVLAMYSPHRPFWERLFHRSEARKVALHAHIPVLVLK